MEQLKKEINKVIDDYIESTKEDRIKSSKTGEITPHFLWREVVQSNDSPYNYLVKRYEKNAIILAVMLEELRDFIERAIVANSWFRPQYYNDVVLPAEGYKTSTTSDHKEARAIDTSSVPIHEKYINKWKEICHKHGYSYAIGIYETYLHLGFRDASRDDALWHREYQED